jgi:hypothetical protein
MIYNFASPGATLPQLPKLPIMRAGPGSKSLLARHVRRQSLSCGNMCVTSFRHLPQAFRVQPIGVLLCDHHYYGGMAGCLALGSVADGVGWKLSQHSNSHAGVTMAAMIHLAAVLPQLTLASDTHYPWLPEDADIGSESCSSCIATGSNQTRESAARSESGRWLAADSTAPPPRARQKAVFS